MTKKNKQMPLSLGYRMDQAILTIRQYVHALSERQLDDLVRDLEALAAQVKTTVLPGVSDGD